MATEETSNAFAGQDETQEQIQEQTKEEQKAKKGKKVNPSNGPEAVTDVEGDAPQVSESNIAKLYMELPEEDRISVYDLAVSMVSNKNKPDSLIYQILQKTETLLKEHNLL